MHAGGSLSYPEFAEFQEPLTLSPGAAVDPQKAMTPIQKHLKLPSASAAGWIVWHKRHRLALVTIILGSQTHLLASYCKGPAAL